MLEASVASIGRITDMVDSTADRSHDGAALAADVVRQNCAVAQVRQTLENLDRGSQQDAALVEQTASAICALYDQAQALNRTVARFRLPAG
jgi:methyl-accepting chemotaxis protein